MQDFKTSYDFRKGSKNSRFIEDPTYLTFFIMFDYYSEDSPLFNGEASNYLKNVVRDPIRVQALDNFIKILSRVNKDVPWFWQSITGLETTRAYGNLAEPWRGADNPSIEIGCLESVELPISGMIDLYKRAAYDFNRWVEVLPKNLRRFRMFIWVSEIRQFNKDGIGINDKGIKTIRPYFKVELGHCQFDIESGSTILADLKRTPDGNPEPKLKIFYETVAENGEYANSLISDGSREIGSMLGDISNEVPRTGALNTSLLKNKLENMLEAAVERTIDSIRARLLLGNVHGLNLASSVQDAINAGSINGIANIIKQQQTNTRTIGTPGLGKAFDPVSGGSPDPINDNVHSDSVIFDSEGPINQNVHK